MAGAVSCTESQQRYLYLFVFIFLIGLWACYAYYFNPPIFPLDDGFIVLHNAQVLHLGYDRNYLGVPALAGATSPIHLLIYYFLLFFLAPLWTMVTASWLAIIIYSFGLLRLAFIFRASLLQALLFCSSGLIIGLMPYQLLNGVETGWSLAVITWVLCLSVQPTQCIARAILCGLLPFFHPELFILTALLFVYYGWQYWQRDHKFNLVLKYLALDALWIALAAAPWVIWYWLSLGEPFPSTLLAKHAYFAQNHMPFLFKWDIFTQVFVTFMILLGYFNFLMMLFLLFVTPLGRVCLVFIASFFLIYLMTDPSALSVNAQRYIYVIVPILLYGLISCIHHPQKVVRWLANGILVFSVIFSSWQLLPRWHFYVVDAQTMTQKLTRIVAWSLHNLPPRATILVHDAGYMAYATPFHLVDLVGLKTPSNIRYHQQYTVPSMGRNRPEAVAAIISNTHPQYLIDLPVWEHDFGITQHLDRYGWHLQLIHSDGNGYQVYRITNSK